ncbi:hypothetical protein EON67_00795 [archaeon]|nr:MAG: hypothetical protein EON67_00795 [archaeon]
MAAVAYGHKNRDPLTPFTEADWTVDEPKSKISPYVRSKVRAERAAWDFLEKLPEEQRFELATVNPTLVIGPLLWKQECTSAEVLTMLLMREMPAVPDVRLPMVDIRDVVRAHVAAMTVPQAAGKRCLVSSHGSAMLDSSVLLAAEFKKHGYNPPTAKLPTWLLKVASVFDSRAAASASEAGKVGEKKRACARPHVRVA